MNAPEILITFEDNNWVISRTYLNIEPKVLAVFTNGTLQRTIMGQTATAFARSLMYDIHIDIPADKVEVLRKSWPSLNEGEA